MLTMETKELKLSEELKRKIDMVCRFTSTTPIITNGNIKSIKGTNIAYVKPHIIKIKSTNYLIFDECDDVFINSYDRKIKFKEFENYIKAILKAIKNFLRDLLMIGNERVKTRTMAEIKEYYNREDFTKDDIVDIAINTDKEDELFDYVGVDRYYEKEEKDIDIEF